MKSLHMYFAFVLALQPCLVAGEYQQGVKLREQGDRLMKDKNYDKALTKYLEAKKQFTLAQSFGQEVRTPSLMLRIGNGYALTGNTSKALRFYGLSTFENVKLAEVETAEGTAIGTDVRDALVASFNRVIGRCATCSSSVIYWEALANLYRVTGDAGNAARAETEFAIHREANEAFHGAFNKELSGFGKKLGAIASGIGDTPLQGADMDKARSQGYHAKMVIYQNRNKPDYVAETVREMRAGEDGIDGYSYFQSWRDY